MDSFVLFQGRWDPVAKDSWMRFDTMLCLLVFWQVTVVD